MRLFSCTTNTRRQYGACLNLYVTGNGNTVANHTLGCHVGIMTYMTVGHHEAVVAHLGTALRIYAAIDDYMFANHGVIAYGAIRRVAFPTEILRVGPDNGTLVYLDLTTKRSAMDYRGIRHDFTAVANHGVRHLYMQTGVPSRLAKLGLGVDIS